MSNKVNEIIAGKFVEALNAGEVPWQKPWKSFEPQNLVSRKAYRGVNRLTLSFLAAGDSFFLTFNQIKEKGGVLKKGTKGIPVVFWKKISKEEDSDDKSRSFMICRYYLVFPASQVEGVKIPEAKQIDFKPVERCEEIVKNVDCVIHHNSNRAFYVPSSHEISMPAKDSFSSVEEYYSTLFHEIGHSMAKHAGTPLENSFGDKSYSKEELVAEIFACFCLNYCGIMSDKCFKNSQSYVVSWAKELEKNPAIVMQAAAQAQKRFDIFLKIDNDQIIEELETFDDA